MVCGLAAGERWYSGFRGTARGGWLTQLSTMVSSCLTYFSSTLEPGRGRTTLGWHWETETKRRRLLRPEKTFVNKRSPYTQSRYWWRWLRSCPLSMRRLRQCISNKMRCYRPRPRDASVLRGSTRELSTNQPMVARPRLLAPKRRLRGSLHHHLRERSCPVQFLSASLNSD